MEYLQNILICLGLFLATVVLSIAILNFILRYQLIRSGQTDPAVLRALGRSFDPKLSTLKWGLILFSSGLGLVLIHFLPGAGDLESALPYGIELLFIAAGFITYYLILQKQQRA